MDIIESKEIKKSVRPVPNRKKTIIIIVVVLAAALLIGWNMKLTADLNAIANQQSEMQSQLSGVSSSVSGSFSSFAQEIRDMLKAQDSVLADYSVKETSRDLKAGTIQYEVSATPKTYQQGMSVSFVINDGKNSIEVQGKESNRAFTANLNGGFTDYITISVLLKQGDQTSIQVISKSEGLLSETMLSAEEDLWGLLLGRNPKDPVISGQTEEVFVTFRDYQGMFNSSDAKSLVYYVLVNDKIVVSAVGKPGTQTWTGDVEEVIEGFKVNVPLKFLDNLKLGDKVVLAIVITDVNGRRYCAGGTGFKILKNSQGLIFETDEQYVYDRAFGVDF